MIYNTRRRWPCWPDLPPELLSKISEDLISAADVCNFRATCTNFRSSTPPPPLRLSPPFPTKLSFQNPNHPQLIGGGSIIIIPTAVFLLRPLYRRRSASSSAAESWLVAVEQPTSAAGRFLHPLSKYPIKNLPKVLSKFDFIQLSQGFTLRLSDGVTPAINQSNSITPKVIVWDTDRGRFLMALLSTGRLFCIPTNNNAIKSCLSCGQIYSFHDIISWQGMVLAVDRRGQLYKVQHSPPLNIRLDTLVFPRVENGDVLRWEATSRRKRLVKDSNGEVYLVIRELGSIEDSSFVVYKMNREQQVWSEVESLGDKVLFVSADDCFFAKERDLGPPGRFLGNCIVFPKNCFPDSLGSNEPDEDLFKDASDEVAVGVFRYARCSDFTLISSLRGYSDLLWPPPQWLWEDRSGHHQRESADDKVEEQQNAAQDQHYSDASSVVGMMEGSVDEVTLPQERWAACQKREEEDIERLETKRDELQMTRAGQNWIGASNRQQWLNIPTWEMDYWTLGKPD